MTRSIVLMGRTADLSAAPVSLPSTRPATRDDLPELATLYASAYEAGHGSPWAGSTDITSVDAAQETLEKLFDGEFGPFLAEASPVVVDDDGSVVAASLVVERRLGEGLPQAPYLFELFTHPSHRRQGLAEQLVRASATVLTQSGHDRLSLRIAEDNAAALALYLTLDFSRWHPAPEDDDL